MDQILLNIKDRILNSQKVLIVPSLPADGDCLGSSLSMKWYLNTIGISDVRIYSFFKIPDKYKNFPGIDQIQSKYIDNIDFKFFDLVITVDGSQLDRIFSSEVYSKMDVNLFNDRLVCIDHHEGGDLIDKFPKYTLTSTKYSSTTELIYSKIINNPLFMGEHYTHKDIPSIVATWIYLGMTGDSNNFGRIENSDVLRIAADLVDLGAEYQLATDYHTPMEEIKFTGWGIYKTKFIPELRTAILNVSGANYVEAVDLFGKNLFNNDYDRHYKNVVGKQVEGYDLYFIIQETNEGNFKSKIGWRVRDTKVIDYDLITMFNNAGFVAGGHRGAGGAKSKLSGNEVEEKLIKLLEGL